MARVRLFRGEYAGVWERRLLAKGYPVPVAKALSLFLTHEGPLPSWAELEAAVIEHDVNAAQVFIETRGTTGGR